MSRLGLFELRFVAARYRRVIVASERHKKSRDRCDDEWGVECGVLCDHGAPEFVSWEFISIEERHLLRSKVRSRSGASPQRQATVRNQAETEKRCHCRPEQDPPS
ncbi:hypothetical protein DQ04_05341050 [Trypanosoma grayi]|uniref:hypothetical protein n=1 Tax=Trypanosoma grayi TaxID=71804 RepID=UPI0004F3F694|nr:hypothetical protein DQ04_05341050 [Trypanosoma grayi]KEG09369.1 hypothetical protein DQ04_05341050 [Trypanosoma grayi]